MRGLQISIENNQAPSQQDIRAEEARNQTVYDQWSFRIRWCKNLIYISLLVFALSAASIIALGVFEPSFARPLVDYLAGCTIGAFILTVILALVIDCFKGAASDYRNMLVKLTPTPSESCSKIKNWLVNPEIAAYRDTVVAQGRRFINAEVEAMENHFSAIEQQKINEEACRQVYLENLTQQPTPAS